MTPSSARPVTGGGRKRGRQREGMQGPGAACTAGRGWSIGIANRGGAPASASRQELEQRFADWWREPRALPGSEVRILQRQRGRRRAIAVQVRRVAGGQFGEQHVRRPAVADEVMQRQQEDVMVGSQLHQRGANQWTVPEIERRTGVQGPRKAPCLRDPCIGRQRLQIVYDEGDRPRRRDARAAASPSKAGNARSQHVMTRGRCRQARARGPRHGAGAAPAQARGAT